MRSGFSFMIFFLLAGLGLVPGVTADTFYLGGIQVNEPDHQKWVQTLKKEGMNTAAVTAYAYQGDWSTDQLWFKKENPGLVS